MKTHYRKAFNSPYLSSADIVGPTVLTISHVTLELDQTKKTRDLFNTAHFVEKEIRKDEKLKPMILNASNSKMMSIMTGSVFIEDWQNVKITIYVDRNVRFGKETVEGLRISPFALEKKVLTPDDKGWANAKAAYLRDGNLDCVLTKVSMSNAHQAQLVKECASQ